MSVHHTLSLQVVHCVKNGMFILESKHCKNTGFLILKIKQRGAQKMKLNMSIYNSAHPKIEWLLPVFCAIQTCQLITNIGGRWFLCGSNPCPRNPTSTFLTIWENSVFPCGRIPSLQEDPNQYISWNMQKTLFSVQHKLFCGRKSRETVLFVW